jgi:serine/threonine-protein kinase
MFDDGNISNAEIKSELEYILSTRNFQKSSLLSKFLKYVVEKRIDGNHLQIKEYTVGLDVFNKPSNFSPQTDASVRIAAIRLRKLLEEYYQEENINPGGVRIHLPKGSYSPMFSKNRAPEEWEKAIKNTDTQKTTIESICFIPFTGFIHDKSIDFPIEGFTSYLSEKLSLFQEMRVISYNSVSAFFKAGGSLENLADSLKVTYYLSGNVEINVQKVEVSIQLFDAASNTPIWSHDFSEERQTDAFDSILESIVTKIVSSIAGYSGLIHYNMFATKAGNIPKITDAQASAVFWSYHLQARLSEKDYRDALLFLEKANHENPNCDLCWSVLARFYALSIVFNFNSGIENPLARAQAYLARAFAINPKSQDAHLTLGWISILTHDYSAAITAIDTAIEINPNAAFATALGCLLLSFSGEYKRAEELMEHALTLHPLPYWWLSLPAIFRSLKNGDYEKALYFSRKPGTPAGTHEHIYEMIALFLLNKIDALKKVLSEYLEKYPDGINHALVIWPRLLSDKELAEKITLALEGIKKSAMNNT